MAEVDTSIYGHFTPPVRSVQDIQSADLINQLRGSELQKNQLSLRQAQDVMGQRQRLSQAVQSGEINLLNPEHHGAALTLAPDIAPGLIKTIQEGQTSGAKAKLDLAQAGEAGARTTGFTQDQAIKANEQHLRELATVTSPDEARQWALRGLQSGVFNPEKALAGIKQIPDDPAQFEQWKQRATMGGVSSLEQLKQTEAKPTEVKLGNVIKFIDLNPYSKTFRQEVSPPQTVGQSPDNAATNATHVQTTGMTQAAENLRAGVNPTGGLTSDMETTAKAIANGQLPPPTGMALLNPRNQRVLARVMEINPDYDATTVSAKKAAATAFTSGPLGNQMRNFATAGQHLDQLGQLVDAMDNGDIQLVNKIGNTLSQQTGSPKVTNFDAAKQVVSKEVMKAIVAGGGGVEERRALEESLANAKSTPQLKGVIRQYRNLMSAQHDNLLAQRRAAGLPDSTMPSYAGTTETTQAPAVPQAVPGFKILGVTK